MILAQLIWIDKRGGGHVEQGQAARLATKLETLRRPADLWLLDEQGDKLEIVGGCEPCDHADDRRIKWNWWYDKEAVGLPLQD